MSRKRIQQIERRIARIKEELQTMEPMRPGSLTRQYKDPGNRVGAYWQISYTRHMKSRTEAERKPNGSRTEAERNTFVGNGSRTCANRSPRTNGSNA